MIPSKIMEASRQFKVFIQGVEAVTDKCYSLRKAHQSYVCKVAYKVGCKVVDIDKSKNRVRIKFPNGSAKWYPVDRAIKMIKSSLKNKRVKYESKCRIYD